MTPTPRESHISNTVECDLCWGLVRRIHWQRHLDWHTALDKALIHRKRIGQ